MAARLRFLISDDQRRRRAYWLILAVLLVLHVFLFRGVLASAPAIMHGDASIVREELIPFFTPSEYFPASSSQLTGSDEFRVTYSFWTSWLRYNPILPFTLVIVNTLSAFMLFYAFFRIVRHFVGKRQGTAMYAALLAALLIHGVLLYAKIAHFYTLILGFSMFALSVSLVLEQLLFAKNLDKRNVLAVSGLVLLNPAIHYHVIFYLVMGIALLLSIVLRPQLKHGDRSAAVQRNLGYVLLVGLLSLLPYLLYLKLTAPAASAVFSQTPVNYWMIYYSSVPLQFLFSLDSLGHLDLYHYGNYLAPWPRMLTMIGFGLVASLVFFKQWRNLDRIRRTFLLTLLILLLLAMWMSIGYSSGSLFSFHNFLGSVGAFVAAHANAFTTDLGKLLDIFINVLRFPHRFELIVFYAAGILVGIGLAWLASLGGGGPGKKARTQRAYALAAASLIIFVPFLGSSAYRRTFVSGDFGGFLAPYSIPRDLSYIKTTLAQSKEAKRLFILPSMESGRQIPGQHTDYTFLDKYLIYYLGQPTLYNGTGADTTNKIVAFMAYRAIAYDEDWWQDILIHNLGITHLLVPKRIENRPKTITYFPGIEKKLAASLERSERFQPLYEGPDYALYEVAQTSGSDGRIVTKSGPDTLVDLPWEKLLSTLHGPGLGANNIFFPVQMNRALKQTSRFSLITDSPERSFYRLYTSQKGTSFSPTLSLLPFTSDLIASSDFTTNMFSLSTLYNKESGYNYTGELVPSLLNVRSAQFIGLKPRARAPIVTQINVPENGNYRLLLHAAGRAHTIQIVNGDHSYELSRLAAPSHAPKGHIDFNYYTIDLQLTKGVHTLAIKGGEAAILAEHIGLIPKRALPKDFASVHQQGITITPGDKPGSYTVELKP